VLTPIRSQVSQLAVLVDLPIRLAVAGILDGMPCQLDNARALATAFFLHLATA
jgi:hypothetical protein